MDTIALYYKVDKYLLKKKKNGKTYIYRIHKICEASKYDPIAQKTNEIKNTQEVFDEDFDIQLTTENSPSISDYKILNFKLITQFQNNKRNTHTC